MASCGRFQTEQMTGLDSQGKICIVGLFLRRKKIAKISRFLTKIQLFGPNRMNLPFLIFSAKCEKVGQKLSRVMVFATACRFLQKRPSKGPGSVAKPVRVTDQSKRAQRAHLGGKKGTIQSVIPVQGGILEQYWKILSWLFLSDFCESRCYRSSLRNELGECLRQKMMPTTNGFLAIRVHEHVIHN